ncbi:MAG: hypothetical protein JWO06_993 [Bacteroidota bacterium]|nr:hypothetical protein [Bacteroidota bacterium]
MKTVLFIVFMLSGANLLAQSARGMIYKAIAHDAAGNAVSNKTIHVRFTVFDSLTTRKDIFTEGQTGSTNKFGLYSARIGPNATILDSIIYNGNQYIQAELFVNDTLYSVSTGPLISKPYAVGLIPSGIPDSLKGNEKRVKRKK